MTSPISPERRLRAPAVRAMPYLAPVLGAIILLALVLPRLMPGVGFWDTGEFQTVGPVLGTAHPTGFPSYVTLGWLASIVLAPFGEPALRINLLSALLAAVAVAMFVALARRLSGFGFVALALGVALILDPVLLRLANHADAHVFHLLLLAATLLALVTWEQRHKAGLPADRWLLVAAAIYGVAVANHTLALLLAPAIGVYVLAVQPGILLRPKLFLGAAALLFGVIALFYAELPVRALMGAPLVYGHPETFEGFKYIVLAEQFTNGVHDLTGDMGGKFASVAASLSGQLGSLLWLAPLGFITTLWRQPRYAVLSGLAFAVTCLFAASYSNADIERYYLGPALLVLTWLAVLAGVVVEALDGLAAPTSKEEIASGPGATDAPPLAPSPSRARAVWALDLTVALMLAAILVTTAASHLSVTGVDESKDTWAAEWTAKVLTEMDQNAVVVSWWSYSTPLWYAQRVEGRRPDIYIIDDRTRLDAGLGSLTETIDRYLGQRPVYLIRFENELTDLRKTYTMVGVPDPDRPEMWLVTGRVTATP